MARITTEIGSAAITTNAQQPSGIPPPPKLRRGDAAASPVNSPVSMRSPYPVSSGSPPSKSELLLEKLLELSIQNAKQQGELMAQNSQVLGLLQTSKPAESPTGGGQYGGPPHSEPVLTSNQRAESAITASGGDGTSTRDFNSKTEPARATNREVFRPTQAST